ncbi:MAG: hypothetical protein AAF846_23155 [Chloroflexota bacterium]
MRKIWMSWSAFGIGLTILGIALLLVTQQHMVLAHGDDPLPTSTPHHTTQHTEGANDFTYYRDIEPILQLHCGSCHNPGGIGHTSYALDDIAFVQQTAPDMGFVVSTGYMPPWMPGGDSPDLLYDKSLSDNEIDTIVDWAQAGAPLGDIYDRTSEIEFVSSLINPDVILEMPEPYTPTGEVFDDYRCFLLEPGFETDTSITGFDIIPGQPSIVHHVIIYRISDAQLSAAQAIDAEDEAPGWECYGGTGLDGGTDAVRQIAETLPPTLPLELRNAAFNNLGQSGLGGGLGSWAPGSAAIVYPEGSGRIISAGSHLIMQVHYNLSAPPVADQTRLILDTTEEEIVPLSGQVLLGPVEIPCPAGVDNELCDRELAVEESPLGFVSDVTLSLCGQTLEDMLPQDNNQVTLICDQPIRHDGWIVMAGAHMHELGEAIRMDLHPDTSQQTPILDIPIWDFHWQDNYWLAEPIFVEAGDTIRLTCTWRSDDTDRYVVWGEGTQDEMCIAPLLFLPYVEGRTPSDFGYTMNHEQTNTDHHHHHEQTIEVAQPTSVHLDVQPDPMSGWNVQIITEGFGFAPENASSAHIEGEGHAHLFLNGEQIARVYSEWYHIAHLPMGTHEITVTLNANSHETLTYNAQPLTETVQITVE